MEFKGFERQLSFLSPADRQAIMRDMREIMESKSSLYQGQRIGRLQKLLAPYGYFTKALDALRDSIGTQKTGYSYMYGYRNAMAQLPGGAVQAMIDRNLVVNATRDLNNIGEWTKAIALTPPPASGSAAVYARWVEEMIANKPKRLTGHLASRVPRDPQAVLLDCFRAVDRAVRRLPSNDRVREKIGRELIGLVMTRFEFKPEKFYPVEVPLHFATQRNQFTENAVA